MENIKGYFLIIRYLKEHKNELKNKYNVISALAEYKRTNRKKNNRINDTIKNSIQDSWHYVYHDDLGESMTKFRILRGDYSDEELNEYIKEERIPMIYSPYDCTGRLFTYSIYWTRVKIGVAIIHNICRDV